VTRELATTPPHAMAGALEVLAGGRERLLAGLAPIVPVHDAPALWDESGRIRLGYSEQVEGARGKRAVKLDHYRLTCVDPDVLAAAAERYGGDVEPWDDAPGGPQFQLFVTADWLPVIVPPAAAGTQAWEHWDKPGGLKPAELRKAPVVCLRRCDGRTERVTGGSCLCAAEAAEAVVGGDQEGPRRLGGPLGEEGRTCKLHTRLSVLLHELPDFGMWRLDTAGWNAGHQLATFLLLVHPGLPRYAKLQLGIRIARRRRQTPKGWQTVTFPVPVLRPDPREGLTVGDLLGGHHPRTPGSSPSSAGGGLVAELADEVADQQHEEQAAAEAEVAAAEEVPGEPVGPPTGEPGAPPPPPGPEAGGAMERHPVVAWCLQHGLAPGSARLFLATQHPGEFGRDSAHPLGNLNDLAQLPGAADDPGAPAGRALALLEAKFTDLGEPRDWADPDPDPDRPQQGRLDDP
jgi:Recombination directionality factor-like